MQEQGGSGTKPKCIRHTLSQGQAPTTHPKDEGAAFLAAQFFSQMGGGGRAKPVFPTSPPRGLGELLQRLTGGAGGT